jgi:hypothetical protein
MKKMAVYSENRKVWLMKDVNMTESFGERLLGLMGKSYVGAEALLISPCNSIHMFFMKMPIDAVFLDGKGCVIAVNKSMKPWTISRIYKRGRSVMEMPSGSADRIGIKCGEVLSFH